MRALVADDQAPFRRAAAAVVRTAAGFKLVGAATSGEQAVALARALHPDHVLMDILMAGMGKIEAARVIAAAHLAGSRSGSRPIARRTFRRVHGRAGRRAISKSDFGAAVLGDLWQRRVQASRSAR